MQALQLIYDLYGNISAVATSSHVDAKHDENCKHRARRGDFHPLFSARAF